MLATIGRFAYRRRWPIVIVFVLLFALSAGFAPRLSERVSSGGFEFSGADSVTAGRILERDFGIAAGDLVLVFTDPLRTVDDPTYEQAVRTARAALRELPFVREVDSHLDGRPEAVTEDGRTTYLTVRTAATPTQVQRHIEEVRAIAAASPIRALLTGLPAVSAELSEASERDLLRAELISLPLVLIVLLLVFGTVVAAGIPLLLGVMSITVALAALFGLSYFADLSLFVTNIATLLGLGIGIDYSLLMVSRFREELRTRSVEDAVEATVSRAGKAVVFSGLAVVAGLAGLLIFEMTALRSIGVGGIVVVSLLVLGALTLVPAVLGILGHRVDALALPYRRRSGDGQAWARLARWVMRYSLPILIATVAGLLLVGSPFLRVRFGVPGAEVLPKDAQARVGLELLEEHFQRGSSPTVIVTITDPAGILRGENVALIEEVSTLLGQNPEIASVTSLTTVFPGLSQTQLKQLFDTDFALVPPGARGALRQLATDTTTIVVADSPSLPNSQVLQQTVRDVRRLAGAGREIHVGGETAVLMDFVDAVYGRAPWAAALIVTSTLVVLFFLFGSVVLPLKAVAMNLLSITASYGALVFVFQEGNFQNLLQFEARGFIDATVPVIMFCVLFGLSMDYEVFLLSRVREAWERTGDNTRSVAEGLQRTGGIITGAAAVLVVVSGAFGTADIVVVKALGTGMALAILVDATIVRALLVPATMRLLGNLNWWAPGPLARLARATSRFAG